MPESETVTFDNTPHNETDRPGSTDDPQDTATQTPPHMVPVAESIRYRKRAQTAEQQLEETRNRLSEIEAQLSSADETIEHLERSQRVNELLTDADTIDIDTARLLTEAALLQMEIPDLETAVSNLKRQKPFLFRHRRPASRAMSAHVPDPAAMDQDLEHAAAQAAATGHRRDLLSYLRLRRQRKKG